MGVNVRNTVFSMWLSVVFYSALSLLWYRTFNFRGSCVGIHGDIRRNSLSHVCFKQYIWKKYMFILMFPLPSLIQSSKSKVYPRKSKTIRFTIAPVKSPLGYSISNKKILEATSCKHLGIILRSDVSWVDQANYTAQKAWKELPKINKYIFIYKLSFYWNLLRVKNNSTFFRNRKYFWWTPVSI
jgi:hypothetical protein